MIITSKPHCLVVELGSALRQGVRTVARMSVELWPSSNTPTSTAKDKVSTCNTQTVDTSYPERKVVAGAEIHIAP